MDANTRIGLRARRAGPKSTKPKPKVGATYDPTQPLRNRAKPSPAKPKPIPSKPTPTPSKPAPTPTPSKATGQTLDPNAPDANDPMAGLDPSVAADVELKYGNSLRDLQGAQRASDVQQSNVTNWFQQYKDDVANAQKASAAYDAGAQAALTARASDAEAQDTGVATTDAAKQAAVARRSTNDSYGVMLAQQGSAHDQFFGDKARIGGGEAVDQHLKEAARKTSLGQQISDLKQQEGAYAVSDKAALDAAQHKSDLEDQAFGLDAKTEQDNTDAKAADRSVSRKNTRDRSAATKDAAKTRADAQANKPVTSGAFAGMTNAEINALTPAARQQKIDAFNKGKGKKGPSTADIRQSRQNSSKALQRLSKAKSRWDALSHSGKPTGRQEQDPNTKKWTPVMDPKTGLPESKPATPSEIKAQLSKEGYSANEIHLMLTEGPGKWGPLEIQMAHELGIRVPRSYIAPQSTGRPNQTTASDGAGQQRPT